MTPHNEAKIEDIASTVIMPGDPLRAEFIAKTYLTDYKLVNKVRNMLAYTGYYKDKLVTVMAHGMGMPSIGIYSYELYKFYNVENIIRIGSCGAYTDTLKLYDVILVDAAYSESNFAKIQNGYSRDTLTSSEILNNKIIETAKKNNIELKRGTVHTTDVFYQQTTDFEKLYKEHNCLAVEMESFALFHNAKVMNKNAACLLTVSDSFVTKEETTPEERQNSFTTMIELALNSIL